MGTATTHSLQSRGDLKWKKRKRQLKATKLMNESRQKKQKSKRVYKEFVAAQQEQWHWENKNGWMTPQWLMSVLRQNFDTHLDAACSVRARRREAWKGLGFITAEQDGLATEWNCEGWVYCNPPYSAVLPWMEKARSSVVKKHCAGVVMLLPNYTLRWPGWSPKWFATAKKCARVLLIDRAIQFERWEKGRPTESLRPAPFLSMLVVVGGKPGVRGLCLERLRDGGGVEYL